MVGVLLARAGLTALLASVNPDLACPCFLLISSEAIGRSAYPGRGRSCWLPRYSSFKAITPCTSPQASRHARIAESGSRRDVRIALNEMHGFPQLVMVRDASWRTRYFRRRALLCACQQESRSETVMAK
jgi:hypothetical protein